MRLLVPVIEVASRFPVHGMSLMPGRQSQTVLAASAVGTVLEALTLEADAAELLEDRQPVPTPTAMITTRLTASGARLPETRLMFRH